MSLSAFKRCANGFRCSSRKPVGRRLYEQIIESHGGAYQNESFTGPFAARSFALAMAIARARSTLERAKNQADPLKCYDLLTSHERHYGLSPASTDSLDDRRRALAAAMLLTLGPKRGNVEYQLQTALGDDFVAWVTTEAGPATSYPDNPWESCGVFNNPPAWKTIRITQSIAFTGTSLTVPWTHEAGDDGELLVGDKLVVQPGDFGQQELVTVTARTQSTLTATFSRPHEANSMAIRRPWPFWCSISKLSMVVVKNGRARDPVLREKATRVLRKLLGNGSAWDIVEENSPAGTTGGIGPGFGEPNITSIQQVTL